MGPKLRYPKTCISSLLWVVLCGFASTRYSGINCFNRLSRFQALWRQLMFMHPKSSPPRSTNGRLAQLRNKLVCADDNTVSALRTLCLYVSASARSLACCAHATPAVPRPSSMLYNDCLRSLYFTLTIAHDFV